jgi:hypothetical protein
MYRLSAEAYNKAVTLLPNDADWHYGYADLLCQEAIWYYTDNPTREAWVACASQLKAALDINPDHKAANELLQEIKLNYSGYDIVEFFGSTPDYIILTPGPTWTARPTRDDSTHTTAPTSTPQTPRLTLTHRATTAPTRAASNTAIPEPQVSPVSPTVETENGPGTHTSDLLIALGTIAGLVLLVVVYKQLSKNK